MARHEVVAAVTGSVWMAVVAVGQTVSAGEQVVILECMKMEIPLVSDVTGTVMSVLEAGTVVAEGDVVAVIEDV